jgi:sugar transferase (PEP-CTERM/EpsH1 system associated)
MRPIRILHVLHAFSAGGLENGVVNIINRSPEHLVHELCLLSHGGEFIQRLNRPVIYHELNRRAGNDPRLIFRLQKLFRSRDFDIIHTRNWSAFDGILAACLTPGPIVIHGEHGRDISDPSGMKHHRNMARRALAFRTKKFVAVSKDLYRWLQLTVRVPQSKLEFIPNGVDTDRFYPARDLEFRRQLGIEDDEFVVGTIARLDPVKNHEGLINAVRFLNSGARKVRLIIVGEGPNRPNVESALKCLDSRPGPLLLGYRGDVDRLYRTFDLFVLNSFAEGMSNTLLEAMASGLPIVCTSVGGNTELVADGHRGRTVRPGDDAALAESMREYLVSPEIRARHAHNARQFVMECFSLDRMVEKYVSLYESAA